MKHITKLLLLNILLFCFGCSASGLTFISTTCEMQVNPIVISSEKPRFGWEMTSENQGDFQKAYRVLVYSNYEDLKKGKADIWDSGKTKSGQSQFVEYNGPTLIPGKKYFWSVTVWNSKGKKATCEQINSFALAPSNNMLKASWIGAISKSDSHLPKGRNWHVPSFKNKTVSDAWKAIDTLSLKSIQLRKEITIKKELASAMIYISGLGHFELSLNGYKVGKSEFDPMWSDYDKTVYYVAYDVRDLLKKGDNAIGVVLGNGFYNTVGNRYSKIWVSFGPPTLFMQLELTYTDGSSEKIITDKSWKYSLSPITFNDIFGGESYDARLEQKDWNKPGFKENELWKPVVVQESPLGIMRAQTAPAIKVMKSFPVKAINKISAGTTVLNMGQNLSGYPEIKVNGKKGSTVKLTVGELLSKDGRVSQKSSGGPYYFEYTLKGEGVETWSPKFSYYGFQYIQVEGADIHNTEPGSNLPVITDIKSLFVYNSADETGTFKSSNDIFNKAHDLIQNAVKSNFQAVFTDCPHREKLGWLEEDHLNGPVLFYNYNLTNFVPKLIQDMEDAQNPNGLVPSIAPEYCVFGGDFSDSPEWGVSSIIVPWMYYEYYGDASLIRKSYPMMKKYIDFLTTRSDSGILSHGLGDWYDYGKHAAGYAKNSPIAISATSHYYFGIDYLVRSAELLGKKDDVSKYRKLGEFVKQAYNKKFFNPETKQYATGSQFSNAVSVYMNLVEPENRKAVLDNLVADIQKHGNRLTTGDVGNRYLFQTLAENNLNELMYTMNNHYEAPGYGYQLQYGVTTLTEQWDPKRGNSWNHFMMGQIDEWFYKTLAGIQADIKSPGFKHFFVKPLIVGDMTYVDATHKCLYGTIGVSWKKNEGMFKLKVQVPFNTKATVIFPDNLKNIRPVGCKADVNNGKSELDGGTYNFEASFD